MTALERRSSIGLALIFALRMLGLFLVLPVFMLEARQYTGGRDPALVGLAMGIYGLTQAFFQLPLGIASDRFGRKRVIVLGLLVFAAGSLVAALADSVMGLLVGRALQGAGAVSAAVTALLADQTRDTVRTKAMALVGISIGLMFAIALVLAPLLTAYVGLSGLFTLTL
ncbi:MAG: MFS transporter, partial [Microbacteriaceae bacterium]|nr:MFS transporter [Microbacteriaceae bacterium]